MPDDLTPNDIERIRKYRKTIKKYQDLPPIQMIRAEEPVRGEKYYFDVVDVEKIQQFGDSRKFSIRVIGDDRAFVVDGIDGLMLERWLLETNVADHYKAKEAAENAEITLQMNGWEDVELK